MLAVIGGSGLARLAGLERAKRRTIRTPYGKPSGAIVIGRIGGGDIAFLARHGEKHTLPPHRINYRANLWSLGKLKADAIVSIATVGGIRRDLAPGTLLVPDQIIDYTWGRSATFFEGGRTPVTHVDFTHPYAAPLRARILQAAKRCGEPVLDGGTYAATQGPRLESAAEIDRLERDGAHIVGMTGMPEASLARELGLDYAALAVVANFAAGRGDSARAVDLDGIARVLDTAMARVRRIIAELARA